MQMSLVASFASYVCLTMPSKQDREMSVESLHVGYCHVSVNMYQGVHCVQQRAATCLDKAS